MGSCLVAYCGQTHLRCNVLVLSTPRPLPWWPETTMGNWCCVPSTSKELVMGTAASALAAALCIRCALGFAPLCLHSIAPYKGQVLTIAEWNQGVLSSENGVLHNMARFRDITSRQCLLPQSCQMRAQRTSRRQCELQCSLFALTRCRLLHVLKGSVPVVWVLQKS